MPLGLAVATWCYYHFHGIRVNGFGYIKNFMGPVWWMSPLLFPIEIVSDLTRVLSLTVRLYANMFAGDLLTMAFFSLIPDRHSADLPGAAPGRGGGAGVCVYAAGGNLSFAGDVA